MQALYWGGFLWKRHKQHIIYCDHICIESTLDPMSAWQRANIKHVDPALNQYEREFTTGRYMHLFQSSQKILATVYGVGRPLNQRNDNLIT